jgi:hypothetical protein
MAVRWRMETEARRSALLAVRAGRRWNNGDRHDDIRQLVSDLDSTQQD